jgi:anthranilate phosphoribosyltransferase
LPERPVHAYGTGVHNTKRMTPPPSFSQVYAELKAERSISPLVARRVFDTIFAGGWTPVQIGAFLVALDLLDQSGSVLGAAAKAMRARMTEVKHGLPLVFDSCGTGGDGRDTVNVSTAAAMIVAAAGIPVAKHGNRGASSRTGAADVLEALGIPLELGAEAAASVLRTANITFLFAPEYHPGMKYGIAPRRELGVPTVFNLVGPLCNPARVTHQLLGTFSEPLRPALASTLGSLGVEAAWVVRSEDGLDEVSPFAPTRVSRLTKGKVEESSIAPEDFGLPRSPAGALDGGDAQRNAAILVDVLSGVAHPARTAFVLNAAAGLCITKGLGYKEAAALAQRLIDTGEARKCLERWQTAARAQLPRSPRS